MAHYGGDVQHAVYSNAAIVCRGFNMKFPSDTLYLAMSKCVFYVLYNII